jgi:serine/threonine protein phosphatase 1
MASDFPVVHIEITELPLGRLPASPDGLGLYAIGDIHGRDDLLGALLDAIAADAARAGPPNRLVTLGDYVDRGPGSAAVIERLSRFHRDDFTFVPLMGNHEHLMMQFLADADEAGPWLANGAGATLASYGVAVGSGWQEKPRYGALRSALARRLPPHHRRFLDTLATSHAVGEYLFVHAGIRPGVAMDDQDPQDLIWIRGPFLRATEPHGFMVVHGHSIAREVDVCANRVGIDTGAFASGRLTALAVHGTRACLITACGAADPSYGSL